MPRRNRVDPFGDLHAVAHRGMFTGNRGCLVDRERRIVRHHRGRLWITCLTEYRGWRNPLDHPGRWTPIFFLDEAVALAAGHRPCGLCRREAYLAYRAAASQGLGTESELRASDLDRLLAAERLRAGRGMARGGDRLTWAAPVRELPTGTVVLVEGSPRLLIGDTGQEFSFGGWLPPRRLPVAGEVTVLTPPTSVAALSHGYVPVLHPSARVEPHRGHIG